jgi:putative sporulation protein YtxC
MELMTIIVPAGLKQHASALAELLSAELDRLHEETGKCATVLTCDHFDRFSRIAIAGKPASFQRRAAGERVCRTVSGILADFIVEHEETKMIRRIIAGEHRLSQPDDVANVEAHALRFLADAAHGPAGKKKDRKQIVSGELFDYLRENATIHLEGIVRFRLRAYAEELREAVDFAVEEFRTDQQYREFISLLKYFVYIQETKMPVAHLLHKGGGNFAIFNDRFKPISTDDVDASFTLELLDRNTNFEDVIVSTLITVSPAKIFIHTDEPEQAMIQTIMQIFENRVELCAGCLLCKPHTAEQKQDQQR